MILKLNLKNLFWLIFAALMITLCANGDNGRVIDLSTISLFVVALFLNKTISKKKLLQPVNIWYTLFLFVAFLSIFWSIQRSDSLAMCFLLLKLGLIVFSLSLSLNSIEDVYTALKIFLIACLVMMLKISFYVFQGYSGSKMWDLICGNYFNTVAQILAISIAIAFFFFQRVTKKIEKFIYIIYIIFSMYHIYLTGSRKGFIMPIIEIAIIMILQSNLNLKTIFKYFLFSVCGLGILVYFLAQNEEFATRLQLMIAMVTSGATLDESSVLRKSFIDLSMQMFGSNPIIGCGINTFASQCKSYFGLYYYSHNNYTELLSGVGLLGTVVYYWLYISSTIKLYRLKSKNCIYIIGFSVWVTLMIFEYGIVTYSIYLYPIILVIFAISYREDVLKKGESNVSNN